ncbi:hypothetical protein GCM10012285_23790 [Streptomyces kronopolitis]|uniref:Uncharacterized protein n=1 Tax=Streptomyces kronopolitis TaxID=1612435 RepID=A0ABQ2JDK1_9ACTN|nr:hypothetical protein GCM10012285_23790 [Streptomyces kronopolitis]
MAQSARTVCADRRCTVRFGFRTWLYQAVLSHGGDETGAEIKGAACRFRKGMPLWGDRKSFSEQHCARACNIQSP